MSSTVRGGAGAFAGRNETSTFSASAGVIDREDPDEAQPAARQAASIAATQAISSRMLSMYEFQMRQVGKARCVVRQVFGRGAFLWCKMRILSCCYRYQVRLCWAGQLTGLRESNIKLRIPKPGWLLSILLCAVVLVSQPAGAAEGTRVALVVGNAAYKSSPLKNPVNDARAIGRALGELGFEVILKENVSLQAMVASMREFGARLKQTGGTGLFYYAGHGMQV